MSSDTWPAIFISCCHSTRSQTTKWGFNPRRHNYFGLSRNSLGRWWRSRRKPILRTKKLYIWGLESTWITRESHIGSWGWLIEPWPKWEMALISILVLHYGPVYKWNKTFHFWFLVLWVRERERDFVIRLVRSELKKKGL